MPRNNADIEEPLLSDTQIQFDQGTLDDSPNNERFAGLSRTQSIICDGGEPLRGDVRLNQATATLAATIIGAGIMALPRAFATLGLVLGFSLLSVVFGLSFFSLTALIKAAESTKCFSYSELARKLFGTAGAAALQAAIVINNSGSMIIYLIIIGDVLCGVAPDYSGLITNLFSIHDPSVFWVSRPFVMAMLCVLCLAPLLSLRNLSLLAPMSTAAVGVAGLFVTSVVGLAVAAIFQGQLGNFQWLPTAAMLGDSPMHIIINLLAVLPVITMSYVCHYNLLPVARSLERLTERRIMMVIRRALIICTALFTAVAASGVLLFGSDTKDNILLNLTPESVAKYVPEEMAAGLCFFIRVGYCLCLMSTFAMLNWALRETITKAVFDVEMVAGPGFLVISYGILLIQYIISIMFPSVWTAMSLTGATAAVFLAYILPGALVARVEGSSRRSKVLGWVCVGLGVLMGVVGVLNTLVFSKK